MHEKIMKILDTSLKFEKHTPKRTKITKKCAKKRLTQDNIFAFNDHHNNTKRYYEKILKFSQDRETDTRGPKVPQKGSKEKATCQYIFSFCDYLGKSNICGNFDEKILNGSKEIHNGSSKWARKFPN